MRVPSENKDWRVSGRAANAVAAEIRIEERLQAFFGHGDPNETCTHCEDIGVIMLARQPSRERFRDERGSGGGMTVDRNGDADPGAADRDAPAGATGRDRLGQCIAVVR
jgi:hypothetical protein